MRGAKTAINLRETSQFATVIPKPLLDFHDRFVVSIAAYSLCSISKRSKATG